MPGPRRPRPASVRVALLVGLALLGPATGCSSDDSDSSGITDAAAQAPAGSVPPWFPRRFVPPAGSTVVDVIDDPDDPATGRTVTWRVRGDFDDVLRQVEVIVDNLGWQPTERTEARDEGAKRTSLFIENSEVYAVRVYQDEALDGVRLTVELPARR